jgi:hypothetical protein
MNNDFLNSHFEIIGIGLTTEKEKQLKETLLETISENLKDGE